MIDAVIVSHGDAPGRKAACIGRKAVCKDRKSDCESRKLPA